MPIEYPDVDSCLVAVLERIAPIGACAREAGMLLRIAIYNPNFTYTGLIRPHQGFENEPGTTSGGIHVPFIPWTAPNSNRIPLRDVRVDAISWRR